MARKLYIFTGQFPYAQYVECFLEDEIKYLSKKFDKVIIVPIRGASNKRELPDNCISTKPILRTKLGFLLCGLFHKRTVLLFIEDFFRNKAFLSKKKLGVWIKGLLVINNLLNSNVIKEIEKNINENDVCYYYWGKWSNLLALFLKARCHHISRFHGAWDLWEDEYDGYTPLRTELSRKLEKAVFISRKGEEYYRQKYNNSNTLYSPLGSCDFGTCNLLSDPAKVYIVSCSTIYPLKRVDLIFESVLLYAKLNSDKQIIWDHFGGGVDYDKIADLVTKKKQSNLSVNLAGNLSHDQVIAKYHYKKYDVFINLSENEGIPVSIMEAISFDIPVIATAVGGNPEIVTEKSGLLVSKSPTANDVVNAISFVLRSHFSPRSFWIDNYCAEKNYSSFANFLCGLSCNS